MTIAKVKQLLEQEGEEYLRRYNYAIFTIRSSPKDIHALMNILRERKDQIETAYMAVEPTVPWTMHPVVCLPLARSVVIPIPYETKLNVLSSVLLKILRDTPNPPNVNLPSWS